MTAFNTVAVRDDARCQGYIKEVNFRESDTQFVYRGARGIVIVDKGDKREGAYVHFIKELQTQFNPGNIYHQVDANRFDVPKDLDGDSAKVFLEIIDTATAGLHAMAA